MQSNKLGARRNWWPFGCASATVLFFGLVWVALNQFADAAYRVNYPHLVATEYMAAQKRQTGKWPADLSGYSQYFRAHNKKLPGRLIDFHEAHYEKMAILQSDDKHCRFVVHLSGFLPFTHEIVKCDVNVKGEASCT